MPPTTQDLRDAIATALDATLRERTEAKVAGEGWTGLDGEIRNLAAALRELDTALGFEAACVRGAPLFSMTAENLEAAAERARQFVSEARA